MWCGETAGQLPPARREAASAVRDTLEIFQWHGEEVRARSMHGHVHGHVYAEARGMRACAAAARAHTMQNPCMMHM